MLLREPPGCQTPGCDDAFFGLVASATVVALLAGFDGKVTTAQAGRISDGVVRIGVINDATGPLADTTGPGGLVAVKMAIDDFQKSHPDIAVEVVYADHQNKPDIGVAIVRKWFETDGVDMVADVGNSAVGLALQNLIRDKNKVVIYTAVATTELTGKQCTKTGFAWLHDAFTLVAGPMRSFVAQGQDTSFLVGADYAFGKNWFRNRNASWRASEENRSARCITRWRIPTTARFCFKPKVRVPRLSPSLTPATRS